MKTRKNMAAATEASPKELKNATRPPDERYRREDVVASSLLALLEPLSLSKHDLGMEGHRRSVPILFLFIMMVI